MIWMYLCCVFALGQFGFVLTQDAWCMQCSWETNQAYNDNSSESIGNGCVVQDLDDITAFDPKSPNPIVNPMCTYDNTKESYRRLLEGPCFDYACYALGDKVCTTWAIYRGDELVNITRFCAVPGGGPKSGCYHQNFGEYTKEVCFCEDSHYCNSALTSHGKLGKVLWISLVWSLVAWLRALKQS